MRWGEQRGAERDQSLQQGQQGSRRRGAVDLQCNRCNMLGLLVLAAPCLLLLSESHPLSACNVLGNKDAVAITVALFSMSHAVCLTLPSTCRVVYEKEAIVNFFHANCPVQGGIRKGRGGQLLPNAAPAQRRPRHHHGRWVLFFGAHSSLQWFRPWLQWGKCRCWLVQTGQPFPLRVHC